MQAKQKMNFTHFLGAHWQDKDPHCSYTLLENLIIHNVGPGNLMHCVKSKINELTKPILCEAALPMNE